MARRKAASKSPFTKGAEAVLEKAGSGGKFISVKADESITIAPLIEMVDLISAEMHSFWDIVPAIHVVCLGEGCPACEVRDAEGDKNEPGTKSYMPVATAEGESKIFPMGVSILRQFDEIEKEIGSIKGKVFKVKRTGSGFKTKYQVIPLGKTAKVDGVEPLHPEEELGPVTADEIRELLTSEGLLGGKRKAKSSDFFDDEDEEVSTPFDEDDDEDELDKWDEDE